MLRKNRSAPVSALEEKAMPGKRALDIELKRLLGFSMKKLQPLFAAGGDPAERKFMECCWSLWKANGVELVEPFVRSTFNCLPEESRSVLFQRILTIAYVAQDADLKAAKKPVRRGVRKRRPL